MSEKKPKPIPGQAICRSCPAPLFWPKIGERPKQCPDCAPNKRRVRPGTKLYPLMEERSRKASQAARRASAAVQAQEALSEFAVLRMAIGLRIQGDGADAMSIARAAQIRIPDPKSDTGDRAPTPTEAKRLLERARAEKYEPLRSGHPASLTDLLMSFQSLNAVAMLESVAAMSPSMRPQAGYLVQKMIDELGGSKLAFPRVTMVFEVEEAK